MYINDFLIGFTQSISILNNFPTSIQMAFDHLQTILGFNEEKLQMTNLEETYEFLFEISLFFSLLCDLICRIPFQREKIDSSSFEHGKAKQQSMNEKIKAFAWSKLVNLELVQVIIDSMSFLDKTFPIR
jgi:hypothetical protein